MNQAHSRAHLTHLGNAYMLMTGIVTGCAVLGGELQDLTLILLTAYSRCRHSKLTQNVLEWLSSAAAAAAVAELIAVL